MHQKRGEVGKVDGVPQVESAARRGGWRNWLDTGSLRCARAPIPLPHYAHASIPPVSFNCYRNNDEFLFKTPYPCQVCITNSFARAREH